MSGTLKKRQYFHISIRKSLREQKFKLQRKLLLQRLHKQKCLYELEQIFSFTMSLSSTCNSQQSFQDWPKIIQQKCYEILRIIQNNRHDEGLERQIMRYLCFHLGLFMEDQSNWQFGMYFIRLSLQILRNQGLTHDDKLSFIQVMDQQKLMTAFLKHFYSNGLQSNYQLAEFFFSVCSYRNIFYASPLQDARLDILIQQLIKYIIIISQSQRNTQDYCQSRHRQLFTQKCNANSIVQKLQQRTQQQQLCKLMNCLQFLCCLLVLLPNYKQLKLCKNNIRSIKQIINLIYKKIFINQSQSQFGRQVVFNLLCLVNLIHNHIQLQEKVIINQCLLGIQRECLLVDQLKLQLLCKFSTKYNCLNHAKVIKWLDYQIHKPVQQSIINLSKPKSISILFKLIKNMAKCADSTKRQISKLFNQRQLMQLIMGQKRSHYAQNLGELLNILAFSNDQSAQYQQLQEDESCYSNDYQQQVQIKEKNPHSKLQYHPKLCYEQIIWQFLKFNYKFLTYKLKQKILFKFILYDRINMQQCDQFFTQEEVQKFQRFFQIKELEQDYIEESDDQYYYSYHRDQIQNHYQHQVQNHHQDQAQNHYQDQAQNHYQDQDHLQRQKIQYNQIHKNITKQYEC